MLCFVAVTLLAAAACTGDDPSPGGSSLETPTGSPPSPEDEARGAPARVVLAVPRGPSQTEKDIWTADDDGDNAIRLTRSRAEEFSPVWSPDGSRIAYRVETADTPPDIWVMNADGSGNRNLTRTPQYTEWGPTWTPDGRRIVYSYDDNDDTRGGLGMNLWIMNADGSNKQPFHRDPWRSDEYAEFSPDGRSVVLISFSTTFAIFRLDANGHNKRRITPLAHNNSFPRWSPDGSMIAFHSDRDGNQEAYVMRRDGSRARNVSNTPNVDEYFPTWLPDGRLSFMRIGGFESTDLWVANADGSGAHRIMRDVVGPFSWTRSSPGS